MDGDVGALPRSIASVNRVQKPSVKQKNGPRKRAVFLCRSCDQQKLASSHCSSNQSQQQKWNQVAASGGGRGFFYNNSRLNHNGGHVASNNWSSHGSDEREYSNFFHFRFPYRDQCSQFRNMGHTS